MNNKYCNVVIGAQNTRRTMIICRHPRCSCHCHRHCHRCCRLDSTQSKIIAITITINMIIIIAITATSAMATGTQYSKIITRNRDGNNNKRNDISKIVFITSWVCLSRSLFRRVCVCEYMICFLITLIYDKPFTIWVFERQVIANKRNTKNEEVGGNSHTHTIDKH